MHSINGSLLKSDLSKGTRSSSVFAKWTQCTRHHISDSIFTSYEFKRYTVDKNMVVL